MESDKVEKVIEREKERETEREREREREIEREPFFFAFRVTRASMFRVMRAIDWLVTYTQHASMAQAGSHQSSAHMTVKARSSSPGVSNATAHRLHCARREDRQVQGIERFVSQAS